MMIKIENADEVLPRLWIGDINSVQSGIKAGACVLNVLEDPSAGVAEDHIPILLPSAGTQNSASIEQLDKTLNWISTYWPDNVCLVHCGAGMERSPLVVAWFMKGYFGLTLDDAYAWLIARRQIVADRREWIEKL